MHSYHIGEKMDFYNFRCAFEIIDDKDYSIMVIHPNEELNEADVYTVNKHTGAVDYRNYEQLYSNCMFSHSFISFIFYSSRYYFQCIFMFHMTILMTQTRFYFNLMSASKKGITFQKIYQFHLTLPSEIVISK